METHFKLQHIGGKKRHKKKKKRCVGGGFKETHLTNETSLSESMSETQLDHLPAGSDLLCSVRLRGVCVFAQIT